MRALFEKPHAEMVLQIHQEKEGPSVLLFFVVVVLRHLYFSKVIKDLD